MDWDRAIEQNREALRRIVSMLVAMAAIPVAGLSRPTLPRHLHRAVLRLLRPAEAAARRLIILAARGLVVALPRPRLRKPKPKSIFLRKPGGTGIWLPPHLRLPASPPRKEPRSLALPLLDPLPPLVRRRATRSTPRICVPGVTKPFPVAIRRPPLPADPMDAARLGLRLAALAAVLDDLPKHARRLARWRARRNAVTKRRVWPLRPGRPPGQRRANSRLPVHAVHDVLTELHALAFRALEPADTS